jgi:hypothetical protein
MCTAVRRYGTRLEWTEPGADIYRVSLGMPSAGTNGVQFLAKVRERSPNTVRIMLTSQAELFFGSSGRVQAKKADEGTTTLESRSTGRLGGYFLAAGRVYSPSTSQL